MSTIYFSLWYQISLFRMCVERNKIALSIINTQTIESKVKKEEITRSAYEPLFDPEKEIYSCRKFLRVEVVLQIRDSFGIGSVESFTQIMIIYIYIGE